MASAVHGVNGAWGILSVGLFYGDEGQLVASAIGILADVAYVAPLAALAFFVIGKVVGNRVPLEDEVNGLDIPEMGVRGYSADPGPSVGVAGVPASLPGHASVARPAPSL